MGLSNPVHRSQPAPQQGPEPEPPELRRRRPVSAASPAAAGIERGTSPIRVRVPHNPQPSSGSADPPPPEPREATSPGVQDPPLSRIPRTASPPAPVLEEERPLFVQPARQPAPGPAFHPDRQQPPDAAEPPQPDPEPGTPPPPPPVHGRRYQPGRPRVIITPFGQCAHHISGCPSLAQGLPRHAACANFVFLSTNPCRLFTTPQRNCIHARADCRSIGGGEVHRRRLCQTCLPDGVQRG